jgi:hypothetical protein
MGRWGWRQIATLCVSVWVIAACGPTLPAATLDPEALSGATLALRTDSPPSATPRAPSAQTPSAPLTQPTLDASSPAPGPTGTLTRILITNTPPPLPLSPPTCLRTAADEVLCLGWIDNALGQPIAGVRVEVVLYDSQGGVLDRKSTTLVQQAVLPAEGAPWTVRFPQGPRAFAHAEAALLAADLTTSDQLTSVPLSITFSRQVAEGDLVRVQGAVRNDSPVAVTDLLVIATLFDEAGRVSGFRVQRLGQTLATGETLQVDMLLTPLVMGTVRHMLYAEGRPLTGS